MLQTWNLAGISWLLISLTMQKFHHFLINFWHFLSPDTHMYMFLSGGKKC